MARAIILDPSQWTDSISNELNCYCCAVAISARSGNLNVEEKGFQTTGGPRAPSATTVQKDWARGSSLAQMTAVVRSRRTNSAAGGD